MKLEEIIDALHMADDESKAFYDSETRDIVWLSEYTMSRAEYEATSEALDEHGFVRLPTKRDIHEYGIMKDFIETVSEDAQERLWEAINGRGAFRRFKDTVVKLNLDQRWYDFRDAAFEKAAREWCEENDIEIED